MNEEFQACAGCGGPLSKALPGDVCAACRIKELLDDVPGDATEPSSDQALAEDPTLIQRFGPYELMEEVGRGGMGVIYKARQPGLDRIVALKMLLAGEFADERARERLLREARIAARLSHPGIVTIHEVGEHEGRPYFAMEFVPGCNLSQRCRDGLLPVAVAVRYVEQLARAVHYAHQHGVIHRDLKPANVLIGLDDEPKLTDFGLTKSLVDPTQTIESAGSPNFMAPEQADAGLGTTGTSTDIFGLGAILYYLLTGRPPAVGATLAETLRNVVSGEPLPPRQLRPALPRDLETIALKCLTKEPDRRYASALEVAEELGRWQRHEPIHARPASPGERLAKWVRRRPVIAALAAAIAFSLLAGLGTTTWQAQRATRAADVAMANALNARRQAYRAEFLYMNQALEHEQWPDIRAALERTRPAPGERDLRGWEWRYLWGVSRSEAKPFAEEAPGFIASMAVLPDGRTLAVGRDESGFELWDIATGRRTYALPEPINRVKDQRHAAGNVVACRVVTIPGHNWLAYTDCQTPTNGWVRIWDVDQRVVIRSFPIPHMPRHLAVSPDGSRIACSTMSADGRVFVFDSASGGVLRIIQGAPANFSPGNNLQFTADGGAVTVEDWEGPQRNMGPGPRYLRVVDLQTGTDRHRFVTGQIYALDAAMSPDGRWMAVAGGFNRGETEIWNLATGQVEHTLKVGGRAVRWSADSQRLWVDAQCWRVPEFTFERAFGGELQWAAASAVLPDGSGLISSFGSRLFRWNLLEPPLPRRGKVLDLDSWWAAALADDKGVIFTRTNGLVYEALIPALECRPLPSLGTNAHSVAVLTDPGRIAIGREDGRITLHEPTRYTQVAELDTGRGLVHRLQWWPRHRILAAFCGTNTSRPWLQFWDAQTGVRLWEVQPESAGRSFSSADHEGVIYQVFDDHLIGFDPASRRQIRRDLDHSNAGWIQFSPDGRWMFSSLRGEKRVVDTRTWKSTDLIPREGSVHGGSFWPDEPRLLLAPIRVVDLETGADLLKLEADFGFGANPYVSPGGNLIGLIADTHNRLSIWRAPTWEEIRRAEGPSKANAR